MSTIMKTKISLQVALVILLCVQHISGCQTNCCQSSSDCSQSCCQAASNCCQNNCQIRCRTNSCVENCNTECRQDNNCTKESTVTVITPTKIIVPDGSSGAQTNVNRNNNSIDFTASINLNNVINNANHVYVPINITSHNINNIVITSSGGVGSPNPVDDPKTTPCPGTKTVTVKVPVPVPVPGKKEPVPYPVPFPVPIPQPYPIPGCCVTVTPCATPNCNPYRRMCGEDCSQRYVYRPVNPCQNGCYKRQYSAGRWCYGSGQCQHNLVDCSYCNDNFYLNYENYQQCGGCYYS